VKAVLYDRVSTDEEKQDPRGHLEELASFAATRGWDVDSKWFDMVSGDPARRGDGDPPGLRRALERLQELGGDGVLVIRDCIRLVRSPVELLQVVGRIRSMGANIVSRDDGADVDTTSDVGELIVFLRGWFGRMFLKFNRRQTRAALAQRQRAIAERGGFVAKRSGEWRTGLGRPRVNAEKLSRAIAHVRDGKSLYTAAKLTGIARGTLRTALAALAKKGGAA
jgi:DNA invertase Pin-like site-specific DNA recombinase